MKKALLLAVAAMVFVIPGILFADDIKGYMIPEYYYVGSNNDVELDGQHGFWVRRLYLGYNTKLAEGWTARVRLEMNSPAYGEATMVPYIKNLHVQYKFKSGLKIIAGIFEPPSFNMIEKSWGYRFIEKTAPDLFKLASSRDFGIGMEGGKNGLVYTVMFGNYGSNKGEDNKGKAIYGRLAYKTKTTHIEGNAHIAGDGPKNIVYLAGFGGLFGSWGKAGAGFYYKSEDPEEGDKKDVSILSVHGNFSLGKKSEVFLRYDHFLSKGLKDPGSYLPIIAKGEKPRLIIAGLNFKLNKMVQISPNIKFVSYGGDMDLDSDFYFNLTAKVAFKTSIGK